MKLAFLGGGNMARALIQGLLQHGLAAQHISVIEIDASTRADLVKRFGVATYAAPMAALQDYDAWIFAVKPMHIRPLAQQLCPFLPRPTPAPSSSASNAQGPLILSIAAGVRTADLSRWLAGYTRIVRAMPNTPALIGQGCTGAFILPSATMQTPDTAARDLANTLLTAVGEVFWYDNEAHIDTLTAITGSGPAYVFYFMEALEQAAQTLGFSPEHSQQLVRATFHGATQLATQSNHAVSTLRQQVTSPGGTTAAALETFEQQGLKTIILQAAQAAHHRAQALGEEIAAL